MSNLSPSPLSYQDETWRIEGFKCAIPLYIDGDMEHDYDGDDEVYQEVEDKLNQTKVTFLSSP